LLPRSEAQDEESSWIVDPWLEIPTKKSMGFEKKTDYFF
jgi:hypothetical protein